MIANHGIQEQWLVEFENRTHVLNLPARSTEQNAKEDQEGWKQSLLQQWSFRTGWPASSLQIGNIAQPFVRIRVISSLRGGKGGFGTLLKGQSRQAGAKLTTDFGACRDLQGRRLRHVNDEIKLRKWREAQQIREQGGDEKEATAAMFDTPSGLYNWHLMVPSWADISKKSSRKIQRQFQRMQREEDKIEQAKQEKRAQYERSVTMYVNKATDASKQAQSDIKSAVQQGLKAQKEKKRKRQEVGENPEGEFYEGDRPSSLCTLSGDIVIEESNKGAKQEVYQIQSQSDFATLALLLDRSLQSADAKSTTVLYYEVKLVTGGLAQIGWADMTSKNFHPNTEEGEGIGDDKGSYGYDGSRSLKFYGGEEEVYENSKWKAGDVVGCQYNLQVGEISYSLNGRDLGVAFTVPAADTMLFPALSSNGGEILELHIGPQQMEHFPKSTKGLTILPVQELVAASIADASTEEKENTGDNSDEKTTAVENVADKKVMAPIEVEEKHEEQPKEAEKKKEPVKVEALNLDAYETIEDLEKLGLDRLKGALMAIDCKCGGDLKQRATRLFSLKGLERKDYPAKVRAKNFRP